MSSNRKRSRFRTVAFRLTAWYLVLFTLVSFAVLAFAHVRLRTILRQRTDEDLAEDLRELESVYVSRGVEALQAEFNREAGSTGADEIFLALVSDAGRLLAASDLGAWAGVRIVPEGPERPPSGGTRLRTVAQPERGIALRVARRGVADGGSLCVGRTLAEEAELAQIFQGILLAAMLGMLVSGGTMGWLLVRRAMSGVERVTQTAVHIGRDRLGERVDVGREGQEIEDLAVAFNEMLERIDTLVKNLREVTDNLAHDLRSPLTRLRGLAETTVISESRLDEYKELAATVVEEADALIALLNTVLEIAETDSGMARISSGAVNVGRLVRETRELFQPAAEDCGIRLECDPAPEDLVIQGDVARLQRVMANLLDNAIKNTPSGGTIRLSASGTPGRAAIVVEDTGTGIDVKDLPRIFDRFYRGDRSRTQPGSGLGLSLSLAIVRAHGGEIRVESAPGKGSVFTVLLPRPAP